jgi:hypothetical protein
LSPFFSFSFSPGAPVVLFFFPLSPSSESTSSASSPQPIIQSENGGCDWCTVRMLYHQSETSCVELGKPKNQMLYSKKILRLKKNVSKNLVRQEISRESTKQSDIDAIGSITQRHDPSPFPSSDHLQLDPDALVGDLPNMHNALFGTYIRYSAIPA